MPKDTLFCDIDGLKLAYETEGENVDISLRVVKVTMAANRDEIAAAARERRRLALSMKQVAAQQEAAQAAGYRPASKQSLGTFADLMKKKHNR